MENTEEPRSFVERARIEEQSKLLVGKMDSPRHRLLRIIACCLFAACLVKLGIVVTQDRVRLALDARKALASVQLGSLPSLARSAEK